jgi:hypothetical protein
METALRRGASWLLTLVTVVGAKKRSFVLCRFAEGTMCWEAPGTRVRQRGHPGVGKTAPGA